MRDPLPCPRSKPHLALLVSRALPHDQRRDFVRAYLGRQDASAAMKRLADWIVARAEALTLQAYPMLKPGVWSEIQTQTFNIWLERLMTAREAEARHLTALHYDASLAVEELARAAHFRSAEALASLLQLHQAPLAVAANER